MYIVYYVKMAYKASTAALIEYSLVVSFLVGKSEKPVYMFSRMI